MAPVKKKLNNLINEDIRMWIGKVDDRLNFNEDFHKNLMDTVLRNHSELLKCVTEVCNDANCIKTDVASMKTQVVVNTKRLDIIEPKVNTLEKGFANLIGKITVWVAVATGALIILKEVIDRFIWK
jgi:hypothetical protein